MTDDSAPRPVPMVRPIPKEINEHMIIYSDMLAGWLFVNSLPPGAPQRRHQTKLLRVVGDALGALALGLFSAGLLTQLCGYRNGVQWALFLAC